MCKHYYIEGQRIASKIGGGLAPSITTYDDETELITGSYKSVSAGLLSMCRRADVCTGFDTNNIKFGIALECVEKLSTQDSNEPDLYFYHSDHIGSSSFITDNDGYASQHLQYLPFGELFVEQRSTANYYTPYKFSGKEKDEETSYSYFGARYYMSDVSVWLSVDPMRDKYPSMSPFMYCAGNPVVLKDPNGEFPIGIHQTIVGNALNQSSVHLSFFAKAQILYGTGVRADIYDASQNSVHLDNRNSAGAIAGYNQAASNFESSMSNGNYVDAGEALHTVADFYSHSNYIDVYMKYAKGAGIKLDANNIPTLEEAMAIPGLKDMLNKELKTGNYKNTVSDKFSKNPDDHENFSLDENKGKGAEMFSGNVTKSEAAEKTAQKDINNRVEKQQSNSTIE